MDIIIYIVIYILVLYNIYEYNKISCSLKLNYKPKGRGNQGLWGFENVLFHNLGKCYKTIYNNLFNYTFIYRKKNMISIQPFLGKSQLPSATQIFNK